MTKMIFNEHKFFTYDTGDLNHEHALWKSVFTFPELDRTEYLHPNYIYFKGKGFKDFYTNISVFIRNGDKDKRIYYGIIDKDLRDKDEYTLSDLTFNKLHFAMTHGRLIIELDRNPMNGRKSIEGFEIRYDTYTFNDEDKDDLIYDEYYPDYEAICNKVFIDMSLFNFYNFTLPPNSMFDIPDIDCDIYINGIKKTDLRSQYHNKSLYSRDITIVIKNNNKGFNLFKYLKI